MLLGARFRKRALFVRTVLLMTLFCLIIVLALATLYAGISMRGMHSMLLDENMKGLEQLSGEFDSQMEQFQQFGVLLLQDFNAFEYLNARAYNINAASRACLLMKSIRLLNGNIYSILLYNLSINDYLLAGESKIGIEQFVSYQPARIRTTPGVDMVFSVITPQALYDSTSPMRTASLILYGDSRGGQYLDRAIIMNLDCRKINGDLLFRRGELNVIADENGEVVFHSIDHDVAQNIADTAYFQSILRSGAGRGSMQTTMGHSNYIVSYIKSGLTGLYTISIKPLYALMTGVEKTQSLFVFIGFAALLVSCLMSYIVSRNIYNPLRSIVDAALRSRFGRKAEGNEAKLITYVLTQSEAFIQDLEQKSKGQADALKEEYLRRLLRLGFGDAHLRELSTLHFAQELLPAYIAAVSIDRYQSMHETAQAACEALLRSLAIRCASNAFECQTVNMYDGSAALLLKAKAEERADTQSVLQVLNDLRMAFERDAGITLTIGAGGRAEWPKQCADIYQQAVDRIKHRFLLGPNMVIDDRLVAQRLSSSLAHTAENAQGLISAIHQNKRKDFCALLDGLVDTLKNHVYAQSVHAFFQTAMSCLNAFIQIAGPEGRRFTSYMENLSGILKEMETIDQAKEWLCSVFFEYEQFIGGIGRTKAQKYGELVEKARRYIAENHGDPSLSVEAVAGAMGYAPYYFSKIYKEATAVNINSTIRQVRIEKAKQLLLHTNTKVNDIPHRVGFVNVSYFCAAFRKEVGLTPSEYRECHEAKAQA